MAESIILTDDELHMLTGKKRKKLQIKWLRENKFCFHVNLLGKPIILRSSLNQKVIVEQKQQQEPDFGALNGKEP
jgi:hypothetical protein